MIGDSPSFAPSSFFFSSTRSHIHGTRAGLMESNDDTVLLTREQEVRLRQLEEQLRNGGELTPAEVEEKAYLQRRYDVFIAEGQRRLREGALRSRGGGPRGTSSPPPTDPDQELRESLNKAGKALYFWGSLVATAVPGYLGKKAGLTTTFLHWSFIEDDLILGALPVVTQVGSSGNHLVQLRDQLSERGQSLGLVVACLEEEEMDGFGVNLIQFAKEEDWYTYMGPEVEYLRVPMPDATAEVPLEAVVHAVDRIAACIRERHRAAYVHCKAGKGRSWMVVMCYLTTYGGLFYEQAVEVVQAKREQVNPSTSQICFAREFPQRYAQYKSLQAIA